MTSNRRITMATVGLALTLLCGCNLTKPLAFVLPEPQRTVSAEFAHLQGTVTVLAWARPETLYDYPYSRLEITAHIADMLVENIEGLSITDINLVEDYLQSRPRADANPESVGRHFGTRYVVYLELLEFSFRDPMTPQLLRGNIHASVVVYDLSEPQSMPKTFELDPVHTNYPDGKPVRYSRSNALVVRKGTYEAFSGAVAKKFYEHKEIIK